MRITVVGGIAVKSYPMKLLDETEVKVGDQFTTGMGGKALIEIVAVLQQRVRFRWLVDQWTKYGGYREFSSMLRKEFRLSLWRRWGKDGGA